MKIDVFAMKQVRSNEKLVRNGCRFFFQKECMCLPIDLPGSLYRLVSGCHLGDLLDQEISSMFLPALSAVL